MQILLIFCLVFQVVLSHEVQEYSVVGSVAKPGAMKWEEGLTLAGVIEAAGGAMKEAVVSRVTLIRNKERLFYDLRLDLHKRIKIYHKDRIEVTGGGAESKIGNENSLEIRITGVPKVDQLRLNSTYPVDKDGMVFLWKIGKIKAKGKTRSDLAKEISEAYQKEGVYKTAIFMILSRDSNPKAEGLFTIGGQVKAPGHKTWKKGMTLSDAFKAGGGVTSLADFKVKLCRNGKVFTYDRRDAATGQLKVLIKDQISVLQIPLFEDE